MTTHLRFSATCPDCGFTSTDIALLNNHSCDIQRQGGRCEDFPCCGHEAGDCNGLLYGSDEAIKSDPHLLCDHENGDCEVEYDDEFEEMEEEDQEMLDSRFCPVCLTEQDVTGDGGSTGGSDPYQIDILACRHRVIAFGSSREDIHII